MPHQRCEISSNHLSLAVAPLGAEIQYLRTAAGQDLLWHGDEAFWTGRAPILFPIVGRAVNDVVEAGGIRAEMKQHGLARRQVFDLKDHSQTHCRHVLRATPETKSIYPFDFKVTVDHEVIEATLSVSTLITNESEQPMPFGFGFHPAFRFPLPGSADPHFVTLATSSNLERRPLRSDGLLEQNTVPGPFKAGRLEISDPLFSDGALVFPNGSEPLSYGTQAGPHLDFRFENLPDLALWRPEGAPFLCIEPWHGTASMVGDGPRLEDRPNSLTLAPGASKTFAYYMTYLPGV